MAEKKTLNLRDATITIYDNTPTTPLSKTVVLDVGDLVLDIPGYDFKDIRDRTVIDHLRKGPGNFMTWSFSAKHSGMTGSEDTLYEILAGLGTSWIYTAKTGAEYDLKDGGDVKLVQIKVSFQKGTKIETIELPNCPLPSISFREADDADTLAFSGTSCQVRPIITEVDA